MIYTTTHGHTSHVYCVVGILSIHLEVNFGEVHLLADAGNLLIYTELNWIRVQGIAGHYLFLVKRQEIGDF